MRLARPPVVAVMGHIDHGKSTLLDYIRHANTTEKEIGGITQRLSAYETLHGERKITFLDTPGHEAFGSIRKKGAHVADIAILVVSAEDGVKPQTLDALKAIQDSGTPYIVAINKIDKPNANVERTKQSLSENSIFVEGYGGDVTVVPISAKTGEGIPDLLDMILLTADVSNAEGESDEPARGIIIEAETTEKSGIVATLVIKNGTLKVGEYLVCGAAFAPIRYIENYLGKKIDSATFSSPIRISGWNILPRTGTKCFAAKSKKEAEKMIEEYEQSILIPSTNTNIDPRNISETQIPIIVKTDAQGSLDAINHEINKLRSEKISLKVIHGSLGNIRESDVKLATTKPGTVIVGFGVGIDNQAELLQERLGIEIKYFSIIYELSDYLKQMLLERTPKSMVETLSGSVKVLKFFSKMKDKQVVGGRVENGQILKNATVKIIRREHEIATGQIKELQVQKVKVSEASEGSECGMMIDAKIEIAPGDKLESYSMIEK